MNDPSENSARQRQACLRSLRPPRQAVRAGSGRAPVQGRRGQRQRSEEAGRIPGARKSGEAGAQGDRVPIHSRKKGSAILYSPFVLYRTCSLSRSRSEVWTEEWEPRRCEVRKPRENTFRPPPWAIACT